jgi:hypothetical protein
MLGTKVDYRVRIMLNLETQRGIPVKCLIEASFLLPPPSFKISSALMPCSLLVSYCTVDEMVNLLLDRVGAYGRAPSFDSWCGQGSNGS